MTPIRSTRSVPALPSISERAVRSALARRRQSAADASRPSDGPGASASGSAPRPLRRWSVSELIARAALTQSAYRTIAH